MLPAVPYFVFGHHTKTKAAPPSRTFTHEKPTRRRHCSPITFLRDPSPIRSPMDPIYLTRRAYLLGTVIPDAKSFVRNILSISSLKPKILVLSHV